MCKECKNDEDTNEERTKNESEIDFLTKYADNTKMVTYGNKSVIEKMKFNKCG